MRPFQFIISCWILVCLILATSQAQESAIDTLLTHGDQALADGDNEEAVRRYQKGIDKTYDLSDLSAHEVAAVLSLYTNLGTALSALGRNEQSVAAYRAAVELYQEKQEGKHVAASASFFLGMVYQDLNDPVNAVKAYRFTHTQLDPLHWAAFANEGSVLHDHMKDFERAKVAYQKAVDLLTGVTEPTDPPPEPRFILSQLLYRIGLCWSSLSSNDNDKEEEGNQRAAHAYDQALRYDGDNEAARHMLAAITADSGMERASNSYIESLFDQYATTFEHSLVEELQYTGYERLRRGFDRAMGTDVSMDVVLDAGCGTGLVGEQFRNVSTRLIGVDLSAAIVAEAKKLRPNLYDETRVGDIINVFHEMKDQVSLIVAADSYIYFGDLEPLIEAMTFALRPNGYIAFTLENVAQESEEALSSTKPDWRWQLTASGRFAHRHQYVESTLQRFGLNIIRYEPLDGFRYERGNAVRGHMWVVRFAPGEHGEEL